MGKTRTLVIRVFLIAAGVLLAAAFGIGLTFDSGGYAAKLRARVEFDSGWKNASGADAALPHSETVGYGETVTLSAVLPEDIPEDAELFVNTNYQPVTVLIDGKAVGEQGPRLHCTWYAVPVGEGDAGKPVELVIESRGSKVSTEVYNALLGAGSDVRYLIYYWASNPLCLSFCFIVVCAALVTAAAAIKLRYGGMNVMRYVWLACMTMLGALWIYSDSGVQGIFFLDSEWFLALNLFSYMLMPVPFLMFVRGCCGKYRKAASAACAACAAVTAAAAAAMFFDSFRLSVWLSVSHVMMLVAITTALVCCVMNYYHEKNFFTGMVLTALVMMGTGGAAAAMQFYLGMSADNTLFFRYALAAFILLMIFNAMHDSIADAAARENNEERRVREDGYRIVARRGGKLVMRYEVETRTAHSQPDFAREFGIPDIMPEIPEAQIKSGLVAHEYEDTYKRMFADINAGAKSGEQTFPMRTGAGEYRWYSVAYDTIYGDYGKPREAIFTVSLADTFADERVMATGGAAEK